MKEEVAGTLYICDACGKKTFVTEGDVPPQGFHATVLVVWGGGDTFEVYSCKRNKSHMAGAFNRAYERFIRGDDLQ